MLDVETEVDDLAVLRQVFLAFEAHLARFAALGVRARATMSGHCITSARMKPRSISEWILPAAAWAKVPRRMVQARTSSGPAVKKEIRSSMS